jgi:transcription antitermination factor NusG
MEAWYVLYTKPNSEHRVAHALTARGFTAFLPLLAARPAERAVPLFPSYLFVRCDLETTGLSALEYLPGLCRVLSFEGKPAVVPNQAIEMIRAELHRIEEEGGLPRHPFKPGDEVIVDRGPLAGLSGVFQGPVGPAERVHILLRFLGQANRAEVPVSMLRLAGEELERTLRRRGTRGRGRRIHYVDPLPP